MMIARLGSNNIRPVSCSAVNDETTWLTPSAHQKLLDEVEQLRTDGRVYMEERLAEARSHGDIRENADYDAAKDEQGMMEARIRQIEHVLERAEIRQAEDTGRVEVGSLVTVVDGEGDEMDLFVAPAENKVPGYVLASPSSPIGAAVLGAEVGDQVSYDAPGGTFRITVKKIRPFGD